MKKLLIVILSLLMAVTAVAAGCGGAPKKPDNGGGPENPVDPDSGTAFKVNLVCNNEKFIPDSPMTAQWSDGASIYTAAFENGTAMREGLDGDYTVTLSGVPDGYTYNPNIYTADNDNRTTEIELYKINAITGTGTDSLRNPVHVSALGAYRLTLTEAGQQLFCRYTPQDKGVYGIESIIDVNENEINPRLDVYVGSSVWTPEKPNYSIDGGGASSVYTKNFKYEVSVANLGPVYTFTVKCDSRIGFPVNIDFLITQNGEFNRENVTYDAVIPEENFKQTPEYRGYSYMPYIGVLSNRRFRYDSSLVGYSDPKDGGDGYYHLLDDNGNITDTIIYAKLKNTLFMSFSDPLVSLNFGGKNYHYLIRGYSNSSNPTEDSAYLGSVGGKDNIPEDVLQKIEALDYKSYIDYLNSDGVYAVTKELKDFLQAFSRSNSYFYDGYGWCEHFDEILGISGFDAADEDQWLFACGYYYKR